jgi:hypothetical protein
MVEVVGDIWSYHAQGHPIVVPTNGAVNAHGKCVMGRGIALQASKKYPLLARLIGDKIKFHGKASVFWFSQFNLFSFPVKHHWAQAADLALIEQSALQLNKAVLRVFTPPQPTIYVPRVGCGNGRQRWSAVKPILERHLNPNYFISVEFGE